jgi:hypothetical protein
MFKRDPERLEKLRIAVRYLLERQAFERGDQAKLARHFRLTRQRVHQVILEEELRTGVARMRLHKAPVMAVAEETLAG